MRTLFKIAGRSRNSLWLIRPLPKSHRNIAVIGCGQFAFATIGYVIVKKYGNIFVDCFDTDVDAAESFAKFYRISSPATSGLGVFSNDAVDLVYVASNHFSHADYAVSALLAGKDVYIEKPLAVEYEQFNRLTKTIEHSAKNVYAGYNRPFSGAIRDLCKSSSKETGPITLGCFISGHCLEEDHWYRDPQEGTRICGNVGHWIDLAVHMLSWSTMPGELMITITYSSLVSSDEDLSISLTSNVGDLVTIVLTARSEPFEGINETLNFQKGSVIAKIDDFRRMEVWKDYQHKIYRYRPKDVGHVSAISQPFVEEKRDWGEIEYSTLLMLFIKDMVLSREKFSEFSFSAVKSRVQSL